MRLLAQLWCFVCFVFQGLINSSSYLFFLELDTLYEQDLYTPIRLNQGGHTGAGILQEKFPHFLQRQPMDPSVRNAKPVKCYSMQKDMRRVPALILGYGVKFPGVAVQLFYFLNFCSREEKHRLLRQATDIAGLYQAI